MSWPIAGALILEGRYRVGIEVGSGSFGTAYLVTRCADGLVAVVKQFGLRWDIEFDPVSERADWESRKRFELEIGFRATSDHLVRVLDSGLHEDHMHVVLEHGGEKLDAHVGHRSIPLDADDVVNWLGQACLGLQGLARAGFDCHRDVCPANLLVRPCGLLKIADFGTVKTTRKDFPTIARIIGHVNFAAPETVVTTLGRPDTKSDVFSLGVVAYSLLTGGFPYPRWDSEAAAIDLFSVPTIRPKPLPVDGLAARLTAEQRHTIERMSAYKPPDRPTPEEVLAAIGGPAVLFYRCLADGCDGRIPYGDRSCAKCRASLDDSPLRRGAEPPTPRPGPDPGPGPEPPTPAPLPAPPRVGHLVLRAGPGTVTLRVSGGVAVPLRRSDIMPDNRYISRDHGRVWEDSGTFLIEDHHSVNGTRVNGIDVPAGTPQVLSGGETVEIADVTGEFVVDA